MYTGIQKRSTTTTTEVRFGVFPAAVSKPFLQELQKDFAPSE